MWRARLKHLYEDEGLSGFDKGPDGRSRSRTLVLPAIDPHKEAARKEILASIYTLNGGRMLRVLIATTKSYFRVSSIRECVC